MKEFEVVSFGRSAFCEVGEDAINWNGSRFNVPEHRARVEWKREDDDEDKSCHAVIVRRIQFFDEHGERRTPSWRMV